jgi:hypothetical protein
MFAIGLGLCHFLPRDFEPLKAFLDLFEACCGSINIIPWKPTSDPDCWDEAAETQQLRAMPCSILIMIMIITVTD